jgi:hypothetical protein
MCIAQAAETAFTSPKYLEVNLANFQFGYRQEILSTNEQLFEDTAKREIATLNCVCMPSMFVQ